jgi:predicted phosphoribosyltransferase
MTFRNRTEAGRKLATALASFKDRQPVVLALPRGGVTVAGEIAAALAAPLDLVLVRKIGVPDQPELAMGAVVEGTPAVVLRNGPLIRALGIGDEEFDLVRDRELLEIERRRLAYLGDRRRVDVAGRVAILVDDGIATGMTMRAAARAITARGPLRLVVATPVAASETVADLRREVDEVVCIEEHEDLFAIGCYYADFSQVDDEDVRDILGRAAVTAR